MGYGRLMLAGVGAAATLLAGIAVLEPSVVQELGPLSGAVEALAWSQLRNVLLVVVFGVAGVVAWTARGDAADGFGDTEADERYRERLQTPPEQVHADEHELTGARLDAAVGFAVDGDQQSLADVRDRLRSLAVTRLRHRGMERGAARQAVDAGTWTEVRTAAVFLSGPDGPGPSLRSRLQLWLDPAAERERRIEVTLATIERLGGRTE